MALKRQHMTSWTRKDWKDAPGAVSLMPVDFSYACSAAPKSLACSASKALSICSCASRSTGSMCCELALASEVVAKRTLPILETAAAVLLLLLLLADARALLRNELRAEAAPTLGARAESEGAAERGTARESVRSEVLILLWVSECEETSFRHRQPARVMQRALAFARTCTAAAASGTSSQLALAGSSSSPRAWFSTSARLWQQHKLGQLDRRLQITFTCTAPLSSSEKLALERSKDGEHEAAPVAQEGDEAVACGHRSTHEFSRRSYEKGIVLVECPSCKRRHLIGTLAPCLSLSLPEAFTNSRVHSGQLELVRLDAVACSPDRPAHRTRATVQER